MKIKWDTTFTNETGQAITLWDNGEDTGVATTLKDVAVQVLNASNTDDSKSPEQKYKRYEIMKAAQEGADLTIEQVAELKKAGANIVSNWLYGQFCDVLDQKEVALKSVEGGA